jgi:hypothetical protein
MFFKVKQKDGEENYTSHHPVLLQFGYIQPNTDTDHLVIMF